MEMPTVVIVLFGIALISVLFENIFTMSGDKTKAMIMSMVTYIVCASAVMSLLAILLRQGLHVFDGWY